MILPYIYIAEQVVDESIRDPLQIIDDRLGR